MSKVPSKETLSEWLSFGGVSMQWDSLAQSAKDRLELSIVEASGDEEVFDSEHMLRQLPTIMRILLPAGYRQVLWIEGALTQAEILPLLDTVFARRGTVRFHTPEIQVLDGQEYYLETWMACEPDEALLESLAQSWNSFIGCRVGVSWMQTEQIEVALTHWIEELGLAWFARHTLGLGWFHRDFTYMGLLRDGKHCGHVVRNLRRLLEEEA